ncbi:MAG: recombination mediator RecR [Tenericutes bacterium]|nr:recombination mediator RecR [Mycoplasmatota bacterium]
MMYPSSLEQLIDSFKYLPGIGEKTAERLAFAIMEMDEERVSQFSNSLMMVKENIHRCPVCNGLTDRDKCSICSDDMRDNTILCVVEDPKSVFLFEKLGLYKGKYHVLKGLISPLDGINPDDIELEKLIERVKKESFKEIILAFKPSIEGETTSLYIKRILGDMNLSITKIASGIPMGADMEYIDAMTLERALMDRKNVE